MADAIVSYVGWNNSGQGWGENGFGNDPIGVFQAAIASTGSVTANIDVVASVAGFLISSAISNVSVTEGLGVTASPNGVSATGYVLGNIEELVWSTILTTQDPSWTQINDAQVPVWTEIAT